MSTNYERGRALEYKAMKFLREQGCSFVTRSAGSHSAADIIAVKEQVFFIQVKAEGAVRKADLEQLVELRIQLDGDCGEVLLFEHIPYKGWKILMIGWSVRDIVEIANFNTL